MSSWMRKNIWSTRHVILDEKKITRNQACRLGWERKHDRPGMSSWMRKNLWLTGMVLLDEKDFTINQVWSSWMRKNYDRPGLIILDEKQFIRVSSFRWLALVQSAKPGLLLFQNFCFQLHCKENLKKNSRILKNSWNHKLLYCTEFMKKKKFNYIKS